MNRVDAPQELMGYGYPGNRLDDALSWGTGPLVGVRPGVRMPVPISSTQFGNAGFDPVMMGTHATMGGMWGDIVGAVVGPMVNWISGADKKAERAAKATAAAQTAMAEAMEKQAEADILTARWASETAVYQTDAQIAMQQVGAKSQMNMLLIAGGLGIGALTLVMVMKGKKT